MLFQNTGLTRAMYQFFQTLIYVAPATLFAVSLHEFAHGYVSYKLGDMTPKYDGRLTLIHLSIWMCGERYVCLYFMWDGQSR